MRLRPTDRPAQDPYNGSRSGAACAPPANSVCDEALLRLCLIRLPLLPASIAGTCPQSPCGRFFYFDSRACSGGYATSAVGALRARANDRLDDSRRFQKCAIRRAISSEIEDGISDPATRMTLRRDEGSANHSIATKSNPNEPACETGRFDEAISCVSARASSLELSTLSSLSGAKVR